MIELKIILLGSIVCILIQHSHDAADCKWPLVFIDSKMGRCVIFPKIILAKLGAT